MRVLFSTTAGAGHFGPSIPVAQACADAGHEVAVAAPDSFAEHVRNAGFTHLSFPDAPADQMAAVFAGLPNLSRPEANRIVIGEVFGRLDAQAALPTMLQIVGDWQPDVVVRDPCEFAALVAALRLGVPQVQVAIGVGQLLEDVGGWLNEPLEELETLAGLTPKRGVQRVHATPTFSQVPPRFDERSHRSRRLAEAAPVWRFRVPMQPPRPALPAEWGDPAHPLVYVSFGTVAGAQGRFDELYRQVLSTLDGMPVRVLMTTGNALDPAQLGSPPQNAHVLRWWPQDAAMQRAALVVGHGGFGTTMTAVRAGVPQIVMPLFSSDQFINAERIHAVGIGLQLLGGLEAVPELSDAVRSVLHDARFAASAGRLVTEIDGLPDVNTTVEILEELAHSPHQRWRNR